MFALNVYAIFGGPGGRNRAELTAALEQQTQYECRIQNYRRITSGQPGANDPSEVFGVNDDLFSNERTVSVDPVFTYPTSATIIFSPKVLPPDDLYSDFTARLLCHIMSTQKPDAIAANDPFISGITPSDTIILDYIAGRPIGFVERILQGHHWYRSPANLPHLLTAITLDQQQESLKVIDGTNWSKVKDLTQGAKQPQSQITTPPRQPRTANGQR